MAGAFENPEGVLASGQTLFVADRAFPGGRDGRVLAVDLRTGAVRVLASGLSDPRGLAMSRGMLLVSDRCRRAIYAIQPASGRIRTLSRGGLLRRPIGIAVRGGTVYAADYDSGTIVAVERSGRQRTFARGGFLRTPMGITFVGRRAFAIDSNAAEGGRVIELRPRSHIRLAEVRNPEGIATAGNRLLVADDRPNKGGVLYVDPDTGALSSAAEDPNFSDPEGLTLGPGPGVPLAHPALPSGVPPAAAWPAHSGPLR